MFELWFYTIDSNESPKKSHGVRSGELAGPPRSRQRPGKVSSGECLTSDLQCGEAPSPDISHLFESPLALGGQFSNRRRKCEGLDIFRANSVKEKYKQKYLRLYDVYNCICYLVSTFYNFLYLIVV